MPREAAGGEAQLISEDEGGSKEAEPFLARSWDWFKPDVEDSQMRLGMLFKPDVEDSQMRLGMSPMCKAFEKDKPKKEKRCKAGQGQGFISFTRVALP